MILNSNFLALRPLRLVFSGLVPATVTSLDRRVFQRKFFIKQLSYRPILE